jgi:hypothetical protein
MAKRREDERVVARGRGGSHINARRFVGSEDAALRQAVERALSESNTALRWDRIVDQLEEAGFSRRTEKSVRNRYLRITRKPNIHQPEPKNRCRLCGEYTRGHTCSGPLKVAEAKSSE